MAVSPDTCTHEGSPRTVSPSAARVIIVRPPWSREPAPTRPTRHTPGSELGMTSGHGGTGVPRGGRAARPHRPHHGRHDDHLGSDNVIGVGGDPYYSHGIRCSSGFSVYGGFVTAGHCSQVGAAVYGWDNSYIGDFQAGTFPGNDYAWVNVGGDWWTVPVVLGWARCRTLWYAAHRGADRRLGVPFGIHDPLALRSDSRQERDGQLQPGQCLRPDPRPACAQNPATPAATATAPPAVGPGTSR
jgi:hypothetical protein